MVNTMETNLKLVAIDYHRNGVGGNGFHIILFDWLDGDVRPKQKRRMSAVVFTEPGNCAILDVAETAAGNIQFAHGNSWRGDHFEEQCRKWIAEREMELDKAVKAQLQGK